MTDKEIMNYLESWFGSKGTSAEDNKRCLENIKKDPYECFSCPFCDYCISNGAPWIFELFDGEEDADVENL